MKRYESDNLLKKKIADGVNCVGGWAAIPDPFACEVYAAQGWDSVTIDMQHGAGNINDAVAMLVAIQSAGDATPLVRVPWNDPGQIMRALDAGAMGIICPMINTKAEAEALVRAGRYPPMGERSFGPYRASQYGADYWQKANEEVLLFAMVETRAAVNNLRGDSFRQGHQRRLRRPVRPVAQPRQTADLGPHRQGGAGGDRHHRQDHAQAGPDRRRAHRRAGDGAEAVRGGLPDVHDPQRCAPDGGCGTAGRQRGARQGAGGEGQDVLMLLGGVGRNSEAHCAALPCSRSQRRNTADAYCAPTTVAMTPDLVHVCDIDVEVGPIRDLGPTPHGRRRIIAVLGGRVTGP